jgi:hypothetical protein
MDCLGSNDFGLATRVRMLPCSCRDSYSGSLYVLVPPRRRRDVFCGSCGSPRCLFGGTPAARRLCVRRPNWALPDEASFDLYLSALRLYTRLLRSGQVCWRCANLRRLVGEGRHYACPLVSAGAASPGQRAKAKYTITAWQARLCTAHEACGSAFFRPREGAIPRLTAAQWECLGQRSRQRGSCISCVHLRRLLTAGRERFICSLQTEQMSLGQLLYTARSLSWVEQRRAGDNWCRGERWLLYEGDRSQESGVGEGRHGGLPLLAPDS